MRELTALEIDRLDFTGLVPEMNMPARRNPAAVTVKKPLRKYGLKANLFAKLPQLGVVRTAYVFRSVQTLKVHQGTVV